MAFRAHGTFDNHPVRHVSHSWLYLRNIGALPERLAADRSRPTEMVRAAKQARSLFPLDRTLARHGQAAYTVTKLGVPLIWIFPFSEIERVNALPRQ